MRCGNHSLEINHIILQLTLFDNYGFLEEKYSLFPMCWFCMWTRRKWNWMSQVKKHIKVTYKCCYWPISYSFQFQFRWKMKAICTACIEIQFCQQTRWCNNFVWRHHLYCCFLNHLMLKTSHTISIHICPESNQFCMAIYKRGNSVWPLWTEILQMNSLLALTLLCHQYSGTKQAVQYIYIYIYVFKGYPEL